MTNPVAKPAAPVRPRSAGPSAACTPESLGWRTRPGPAVAWQMSHFNRVFKKFAGLSPTEYRAQRPAR